MKVFFDTEFFVVDGMPVDIRPISIGLVKEDGSSFYALYEGAREAASQSDWLRKNVLPQLEGEELSIDKIAEEIKKFVGFERPEFCAAYGAYDWVLFAQTFGGLMKLPENWPYFYTETVPLGWPRVERVGKPHHSGDDAATLLKSYLKGEEDKKK